MKRAILYLFSIFSFVSCAPYGSIGNPITLQPEESHDVFTDLLKQNASRIDVELIAALGEHYKTDDFLDVPKLKKAVIHNLSISRESMDSPYGDKVYRVTKVTQASRILADTWPGIDFSPDSKLGLLFKCYPRASIALMECDNQRILFFDDADHLVAIYPDSGGGC